MAHPIGKWLLASALLAVMMCCAQAACPDMQRALDRHNFLRARHGSRPARLSQTLVRAAQRWAEISVAATAPNGCEGQQHDNNRGSRIGENMFASAISPGPAETSCTAAVNWMYSEYPLYDYDNPAATWRDAGHFTQLVWDESTAFGCGMASAPMNDGGVCSVVVCRYNPTGNFHWNEPLQSAFARNVKRPQGNPDDWALDHNTPEGGADGGGNMGGRNMGGGNMGGGGGNSFNPNNQQFSNQQFSNQQFSNQQSFFQNNRRLML